MWWVREISLRVCKCTKDSRTCFTDKQNTWLYFKEPYYYYRLIFKIYIYSSIEESKHISFIFDRNRLTQKKIY